MKTRKVVSMMLAVIIMLALAIPMTASAATVTIIDGGAGQTYDAYRLLDVKLSSEPICGEETGAGHEHGAACYGHAYSLNGKYKGIILEVLGITQTTESDAAINASAIAAIKTFAGGPGAFAKAIAAKIQAAPAIYTPDKSSTDKVMSDVDQGYYLFIESSPASSGEATSQFILDTVGLGEEIDIYAKKDVPSVDKKVSEDREGPFVKGADLNIGDTVYFEVTGKLPSNLDAYSAYAYKLIDTMSAGLTYDAGSMKVFYDNAGVRTEVTAQFSTPTFSSQVLTIGCTDIKTLDDVTVTAAGEFVFTYSATLNNNAGTGNTGNGNAAQLEFSSNPNPGGESETQETPGSEAYVFTFQLDVAKTDTAGNAITTDTAEFALFRMNGSTKEYAVVDSNGEFDWTVATTSATATKFSSDIVTGRFSIEGLKAGEYFLEETKAPDGYNLLAAPIKFVIFAEIEKVGNTYEVTTLEITVGTKTEDGDLTSGVVEIGIENGVGTQLPGTGGIGEIPFIAIGAIGIGLFASAIITFKKRSTLSAISNKKGKRTHRAT